MQGSWCPLQSGRVIFILCCILCHSNVAILHLSVESEDDMFELSGSPSAAAVHWMFSCRLSSFGEHNSSILGTVSTELGTVSTELAKLLILASPGFVSGLRKNDLIVGCEDKLCLFFLFDIDLTPEKEAFIPCAASNVTLLFWELPLEPSFIQ